MEAMNSTAEDFAIDDLEGLEADAARRTASDRLALIRDHVPGRIVFTTSFGIEDQWLTHLIARSGLAIDLVTLDTGRLFPETLETWSETERCYGLRIRAVTPDQRAVETLLRQDGPLGFRRSVESRHACCDVRKVAPLGRALAGAPAWITGVRAGQSGARARTRFVAYDAARDLLKFNPLFDLARAEIRAAIDRESVPYNSLENRGFPSIGCQPCTRAVAPGEDERAGRWWWERDDDRECGLHIGPDGKLRRVRRPDPPAASLAA